MVVKVGIVGLGRLGKIHAENLAKKIYNCELIAATSIVDEELNWAQKELGVKYLYHDFDEMIANDEIDAIFIVSPSSFHPNQVVKALNKNKHVFSEKPLGLSVEDIQEILPVINSSSNKFMLGFMRRLDESYRYAKEKVDAGEIGDITLIRCYSIDPSDGMKSFVNFAKNSNSGGIFSDMSIHDIDVIRWFLNSEDSGVNRVWSLGNNVAYPVLNDLNELETGAAMLQLTDDKIGMLVAGRNAAHGYHVETEIIGTKGTLRIAATLEKNLVQVMNSSGVVRPTSQNFPERFQQAFMSEEQYFIDAISNDTEIEIKAEDGLYATQVAIALQESYDGNEIVNIKGGQ